VYHTSFLYFIILPSRRFWVPFFFVITYVVRDFVTRQLLGKNAECVPCANSTRVVIYSSRLSQIKCATRPNLGDAYLS